MRTRIIIACVILILGGALANYLRYADASPDRPATFESIPMESGAYYGEERRFSEESYEILQADTTTLRIYRDTSGLPIWLFIGYFESQKYGSQIHSPKHCLPGSGWRIDSHTHYRLKLAGGFDHDINRLVISERDKHQLMLYWFETRGGVIRNEFGLKWDLMRNSLMLRPTDAAIIRLNLSLTPDDNIESATARAVDWLNQFYPAIERALPFGD